MNYLRSYIGNCSKSQFHFVYTESMRMLNMVISQLNEIDTKQVFPPKKSHENSKLPPKVILLKSFSLQ